MRIKRGDEVATINGNAIVQYVREQGGQTYYETTLGVFGADEVEPLSYYKLIDIDNNLESEEDVEKVFQAITTAYSLEDVEVVARETSARYGRHPSLMANYGGTGLYGMTFFLIIGAATGGGVACYTTQLEERLMKHYGKTPKDE